MEYNIGKEHTGGHCIEEGEVLFCETFALVIYLCVLGCYEKKIYIYIHTHIQLTLVQHRFETVWVHFYVDFLK